MKKLYWVSGIISLAYLGYCSMVLAKDIKCFNPSVWGSLCFLGIDIVSGWGYEFMHFIGGQGYLSTISPWLYLVPVIINTVIIFGAIWGIGKLGLKLTKKSKQIITG